MRRLLPIVTLLLAWAGSAQAFEKTDLAIPMTDGAAIAATLYTPEGSPPTGGWPAVVLLHGLGKSRVIPETTRWSINHVAETYLANQGYVVLTYDARAHGASGGLFTLDGPREVQDLKEVYAWLAARPEVNRAKIGGSALSYGGGALWLAAAQGTPFAALVVAASWTDLVEAAMPGGLVKTGMVAGFLNNVPLDRWHPSLGSLKDDLFRNSNRGVLRAFFAERSVKPLLDRVSAPVFLLQGRRDFAFDIGQASSAFVRLRGPKRLYIGDLGHDPAKNPEPEIPYYLNQSRQWLDRWLKEAPNGIDRRPPVEVAPDPWTGKTFSYASLPPVRRLSFALRGRQTIGGRGAVVRTVVRTKAPTEVFGAPVVRVAVAPAGGWSHLVAVLSADPPKGPDIVVSDGGAAVSRAGTMTIRLLDLATPVPRGSVLELTLASSSTAQHPSNLLYLDIPQPPGARIAVGSATLTLPVLRRPISP